MSHTDSTASLRFPGNLVTLSCRDFEQQSRVTDSIQVFGKQLVPNSGARGRRMRGLQGVSVLAGCVGIDMPVVDKAPNAHRGHCAGTIISDRR